MANAKGFQKGHKGFKPKGTKEKKTKQWEELGLMHEEGGAETANKILMAYAKKAVKKDGSIDDEAAGKFMDHYKSLLEYFKPKQARVDTNVSLNTNNIEFILPKGYED